MTAKVGVTPAQVTGPRTEQVKSAPTLVALAFRTQKVTGYGPLLGYRLGSTEGYVTTVTPFPPMFIPTSPPAGAGGLCFRGRPTS